MHTIAPSMQEQEEEEHRERSLRLDSLVVALSSHQSPASQSSHCVSHISESRTASAAAAVWNVQ